MLCSSVWVTPFRKVFFTSFCSMWNSFHFPTVDEFNITVLPEDYPMVGLLQQCTK
jgi:fucose permease